MSDEFAILSYAAILFIPLIKPLYRREMNSRLYRVTPYYWATMLANYLTFMVYPIIMSLVTYPFVNFEDSDFGLYLEWLVLLVGLSFSGFTFGLVLSLNFESDYDLVNNLLIALTVFYLGSGVLLSAQTTNLFAKIT
jgi:hypothetical protein